MVGLLRTAKKKCAGLQCAAAARSGSTWIPIPSVDYQRTPIVAVSGCSGIGYDAMLAPQFWEVLKYPAALLAILFIFLDGMICYETFIRVPQQGALHRIRAGCGT